MSSVGSLNIMSFTPQAPTDHLFAQSDSLKLCTATHIECILKHMINLADPCKLPKVHEVHKVAATLAFLRTHSIDEVQEAGQWSSSKSFTGCYLAHHILDTPCVAAGTSGHRPPSSPDSSEGSSFEGFMV